MFKISVRIAEPFDSFLLFFSFPFWMGDEELPDITQEAQGAIACKIWPTGPDSLTGPSDAKNTCQGPLTYFLVPFSLF